jgi:hypothetical protein
MIDFYHYVATLMWVIGKELEMSLFVSEFIGSGNMVWATGEIYYKNNDDVAHYFWVRLSISFRSSQ